MSILKFTEDHEWLRVEGDVAVVVIRDPDDPQASREVYVNKKKLKKADLKEGDKVTVRVD